MIEISGKYVFDLEVGKYKDFIDYEDLIEFTIVEEAGNCLPVFDLKFKFKIPELRNYLTENNLLLVRFGSSKDDLKEIPLRIFQKNIQRYGQAQWIIVISGFYDAVPYLQETGSEVIKSGNSGISATEALRIVTSRYFNFKTNVESDLSVQKWLRCRKTARDFVTDIWLHSNIPNSFPGVTITKNGDFIFKDMIKSISEESKWIFSYDDIRSKNNVVVMSGNPESFNDTGLINTIIQNKRNLIFNMDSGDTAENIFIREPALSTTSKLEGVSVNAKDSINYYTNSNVHPNYWQSYTDNLNNLSFFSSVRTVISYLNYIIDDMNVLDIVEFLDLNPENPNETEGHYSGKYIISKLVRTIGENNNLATHVVLSRESSNEIRDYEDESSYQQILLENDEEYTLALNKLEDTKDTVKKSLKDKNLNLNIPNIKILSEELKGVFKNLIGFDLSGVWIKYDYLLSLAKSEGTSTLKTQILNDLKTKILDSISILIPSSNIFEFIGISKDKLVRDLSDFKNIKLTINSIVNALRFNISNMSISEILDTVETTSNTNFIFSLFGMNKNSLLDIINNPSIDYKVYLTELLDKYINNLFSNSLPVNMLKILFSYWLDKGETKSLDDNDSIIQQLNSGDYANYFQNGNLRIPNLGITKSSSEDFTASIFSWYISGLIDEDSINTGNTGLDNLMSQTIIYLKSEGIINPLVGNSFRRFWGTSKKDVINDDEIKHLYSHISNVRYFGQSIKCNNEYVYVMYPNYMLEGKLMIDGKNYTNFEIFNKNIEIDGEYTNYIVYRTLDKFSERIRIEVI